MLRFLIGVTFFISRYVCKFLKQFVIVLRDFRQLNIILSEMGKQFCQLWMPYLNGSTQKRKILLPWEQILSFWAKFRWEGSQNNSKVFPPDPHPYLAKVYQCPIYITMFQGDSGSPLVCRVNRKWTLVGIHSFRMNLDGCRGGVKAATRVSMFASWIESVIG